MDLQLMQVSRGEECSGNNETDFERISKTSGIPLEWCEMMHRHGSDQSAQVDNMTEKAVVAKEDDLCTQKRSSRLKRIRNLSLHAQLALQQEYLEQQHSQTQATALEEQRNEKAFILSHSDISTEYSLSARRTSKVLSDMAVLCPSWPCSSIAVESENESSSSGDMSTNHIEANRLQQKKTKKKTKSKVKDKLHVAKKSTDTDTDGYFEQRNYTTPDTKEWKAFELAFQQSLAPIYLDIVLQSTQQSQQQSQQQQMCKKLHPKSTYVSTVEALLFSKGILNFKSPNQNFDVKVTKQTRQSRVKEEKRVRDEILHSSEMTDMNTRERKIMKSVGDVHGRGFNRSLNRIYADIHITYPNTTHSSVTSHTREEVQCMEENGGEEVEEDANEDEKRLKCPWIGPGADGNIARNSQHLHLLLSMLMALCAQYPGSDVDFLHAKLCMILTNTAQTALLLKIATQKRLIMEYYPTVSRILSGPFANCSGTRSSNNSSNSNSSNSSRATTAVYSLFA